MMYRNYRPRVERSFDLCSLGDKDCFVFSLKPSMAVYRPTGINDHYMYLNVGMKTIPNGLVSKILTYICSVLHFSVTFLSILYKGHD